jgi:hypothetical protein
VDGLTGLFLSASKEAESENEEEIVMRSAELRKVYEDIMSAMRSLKSGGEGPQSGKVLLIVDALDLLLATAGMDASPVKLGDLLMDLREVSCS